MHAEKLILETDADGHLKIQPKLPPNAQLEAIFLVVSKQPRTTRRKPSARIAGQGKILGDLLAPVADASDWGVLA